MKINIPTNWSEVSLEQFDKILEISNNKDLTPVEREIRLVAVLTKMSVAEVESLDAPTFQMITDKLIFLNTKPEKVIPVDSFVINGKDYHADIAPRSWTAGQFLDYKVLAGEDIDKKAARLLACFIYPEGAAYNDGSYDIEDVVNDINQHMSVMEVTGFTDFFMLQFTAFAKVFLGYSKRKIMKSKVISEQDKKRILEQMNKSKDLISAIGTCV